MNPYDITLGLTMGVLLLVVGLVPGVAQSLMQGLAEGIRNFRDALSFGFPVRPHYRPEHEATQRSVWLAVIGAFFIVLSILAYFSN